MIQWEDTYLATIGEMDQSFEDEFGSRMQVRVSRDYNAIDEEILTAFDGDLYYRGLCEIQSAISGCTINAVKQLESQVAVIKSLLLLKK